MEIYLVGGAVRDRLLGLAVKERDWVVVGATPEEMIAKGFLPVGKDFPVFLHPVTKEEYALARTERKVGRGYKGFIFYTDPKVGLLEDLKRRDLTINAIAETKEGELIDPYHGLEDLKAGVLKHVSPAFAEDPVRILRLARFAAKFPNFQIHSDTLSLIDQIVAADEVSALTPERVWQELRRSLEENQPIRFWEVLENTKVLPILFFPLQLNCHNKEAFLRAIVLSPLPEIRLAALFHQLTVAESQQLIKRYPFPKDFSNLFLLVNQFLDSFQNLFSFKAEEIWYLFKKADAFRRPERFRAWLLACQACLTEGKIGLQKQEFLEQALVSVNEIRGEDFLNSNVSGKKLGELIKYKQIEAIQKVMDSAGN